MEKVRLVRELYGLSQSEAAALIMLPQPTLARYELGKTKKIPYSFLRIFSTHFCINENWLLNDVVEEGYMLEVKKVFSLIGNFTKAAKRLDVPIDFLNACDRGTIVPSGDFLNRIRREFLVAKTELIPLPDALDEDDYIKLLNEVTAANERLQEEIKQKDRMIKYLMDELEKKH